MQTDPPPLIPMEHAAASSVPFAFLPFFLSLCSAFYIATIMSLVCIKHRVLEFNLE
ncbi:hypothetical protein RchiOBHm_Chr3g0481781 [Rosa chinensis]|uniref:Uncharacterized protein n=1 Tax=Rosa chinensis TaxID=74649 RepID=A0A2P6QV67_ROSCH|nr:hypothetical protein RchiOBHm_Chr4g0409751 [Rosa chinensis]PRQ41004.1 hypothetical protein RchiOBHm_Chr4g0442271 [Rosa chinensis]PRQ44669.1 hypothetical protein RchiOBHm_Chr3g0481781 [Rosa chinensis]